MASQNIFQNGLNFELCKNGMTAEITKSKNANGDIIIPCKINYENQDYTITSIKNSSFAFNNQIKSIIFQNDSEITTIGESAFSYSSLERITIPSKVSKIGINAFFCCIKLDSVTFEENSQIQIISKSLFSNSSLKSITIPRNVETIEEESFDYCNKLKKIEFQSNSKLKKIEKNAFFSSSFESLFIPPEVEDLQHGWCNHIPNLISITVSPLNKNFFLFNEKILIEKNKRKIEFACRDIEKVIIPFKIRQIESFSFSKCRQIKSIQFESNSELNSINENAFYDSSISMISIPSKVTRIGDSAFSLCMNLCNVEFDEDSELQLIEQSAFSGTLIEKVVIPNKVRKIEKCSFSYCLNLVSIEFLSSEISIGELCFDQSTKLCLCSFPNAKKIHVSKFLFSQISNDLTVFISPFVEIGEMTIP